jgi:membrane-associated phospholipid phosphatase
MAFMLLGAFFIHVRTRPGRAEVAVTVFLAAVLRFGYGRVWILQDYLGSAFIRWGAFLGLASLAVLLIRCATTAENRRERWITFLIAGGFPYSWMIIALSLARIAFTPRTYDANLLAFDSSLGDSLSFLFGKVLAVHPLLHDLTETAYNAIALGTSCVLAGYNVTRRRPVKLIPMYISMAILGYGLYSLFPAAGPAFAYHGAFPHAAPGKWQILGAPMAPFVAPRNAMPSLHFGAMLLLLWNSRTWRLPGRILAACFSAAIAFATLALGEHYLIDLVVAFPVMMFVQAAWTTAVPLRDPRRYQAMGAAALATAAWFLALRWAVPVFLSSAFLAWACVLLTIAGTVLLERRLARAAWVLAPAASPATAPSRAPIAPACIPAASGSAIRG